MYKRRIIITGANGFIGTSLTKYFQKNGWEVRALVHHYPKQPVQHVAYTIFELGGKIDNNLFRKTDCFIHCAYAKQDENEDAFSMNIEGTKALLRLSRSHGVKHNIFLSSMTSGKNALSIYGKQKFELEKFFCNENDTVLRPGLVLGNGGLFLKLFECIKKSKIIPLVGGGKQPLQTICIDDLVHVVGNAIEKKIFGVFTVAEEKPVSLKEFYSAICKKMNTPVLFVSVPYFFAETCMDISSFLGIKLPVTKENLLGLKTMRATDVIEDMKKLHVSPKNYKESLSLIQ